MKKIFLAVLATALTASAVSGCGSTKKSSEPTIAVTGAYARATDDMSFDKVTKTYMTGIFMTITNNSDHDVNLSTGTSVNAPIVEVHEVVDGKMQKKQGGLTIKSGTSEELKPGGNHVMLMGMSEGLVAGSEIKVTLTFDDGTSLEVVAPVKVVNLEQEHYHSGAPTPMATS